MDAAEPIRILIVDDSRIFRGLLQSVLEQIPGVQVVGSVFNGEKALEFIEGTATDLVTLDVEMPGLGGLNTLRAIADRNRKLLPKPPIDVLLVSGLTKSGSMVTVEGLQLGALDFISKPCQPDPLTNRQLLRNALLEKLSAFRLRRSKGSSATASARENATLSDRPVGQKSSTARSARSFRAIAIGTSTGGPEALGTILPVLAAKCPVPIFIVQHILDGLSQFLAESLTRKCGRTVTEVSDELRVTPSGIYLAKSDRHMIVRSSEGGVVVGSIDTPREKGCRPSVDVFLRSAAMAYGSGLITVILTGMGDDGADGVRTVKRAGGYAIAQDQSSSLVWGMPRAAAETGVIDEVLGLTRIPESLLKLVEFESRP